MARKIRIYVKYLPAIFRVGNHNGMFGDQMRFLVVFCHRRVERDVGIVKGGLAVQIRLHAVAQLVIRFGSGQKHRVAAAIRRDDFLIEHAVFRRNFCATLVGVPRLARYARRVLVEMLFSQRRITVHRFRSRALAAYMDMRFA